MYRGGKRGKAREDSETHRHTGLSLHKKREQLKESRDTSEAWPGSQSKLHHTGQLLAWAIDFKVLSPFILAFERLLIRLTTIHSSLIAHWNIRRLSSGPRPEAPCTWATVQSISQLQACPLKREYVKHYLIKHTKPWWKFEEKTLLELKRDSLENFLSFWIVKKNLGLQQNWVPPQHSLASQPAHLTSHMFKFHVAQWLQRPQLTLQQSSLYHTLQAEGQQERSQGYSTATPSPGRSTHSHPCLNQASSWFPHSRAAEICSLPAGRGPLSAPSLPPPSLEAGVFPFPTWPASNLSLLQPCFLLTFFIPF